MRNFISKALIYSILLVMTSCSGQSALEKYNCKILDTETMGSIKKTFYVHIPEQLTELQLKEIATQIRHENNQYQRLFIFYLLPNMEIGSGAWATTHYNPNLEIKIMGVDKKLEEAMKSVDLSEGEKVGKWYDKTPYAEHSVIVFKIAGKYKMKQMYRDGSINEKDLQFYNTDGKSKFVYKNKFGEYLMIENDGRLGQYDKDGLISTADIIE